MSEQPATHLFSWKALLKWTLFLLVMFFAGRYGYQQWQQVDWANQTWSSSWLILGGIIYFVGWLPAAGVWWWLLRSSGQHLPLYPALRAHYCGHLGKYVPGKAFALVIRAALVKPFAVSTPLAALLAVIETLLTMATAVLVFLILFPVVLGMGKSEQLLEMLPALGHFTSLPFWQQLLIVGSLLAVTVIASPLWARGMNWVVGRLLKRMTSIQKLLKQPTSVQLVERLGRNPLQLKSQDILLCGFLSAIGWVLNGLSLGCVLLGIGVPVADFSAPLLWIAAVAGATALGFLVLFAPGGLGVREAALVALLQLSPELNASLAVVAAILLRMVSFLSELAFSILLYFLPGTHFSQELPDKSTSTP